MNQGDLAYSDCFIIAKTRQLILFSGSSVLGTLSIFAASIALQSEANGFRLSPPKNGLSWNEKRATIPSPERFYPRHAFGPIGIRWTVRSRGSSRVPTP
jgi:hypothetical protein